MPPLAEKAAGWENGVGGRCSPRTLGTSTPLSLIRVQATALLCSLNTLALPAQDEPTCTCICDRGCRVKPRPLLESFYARVPATELRGCRLTSAKASGKVCCPWVDRTARWHSYLLAFAPRCCPVRAEDMRVSRLPRISKFYALALEIRKFARALADPRTHTRTCARACAELLWGRGGGHVHDWRGCAHSAGHRIARTADA